MADTALRGNRPADFIFVTKTHSARSAAAELLLSRLRSSPNEHKCSCRKFDTHHT